MSTEERSRVSFGLSDRHTLQSHATTGTPCDVPEPNMVIFIKADVLNGKGKGIV